MMLWRMMALWLVAAGVVLAAVPWGSAGRAPEVGVCCCCEDEGGSAADSCCEDAGVCACDPGCGCGCSGPTPGGGASAWLLLVGCAPVRLGDGGSTEVTAAPAACAARTWSVTGGVRGECVRARLARLGVRTT